MSRKRGQGRAVNTRAIVLTQAEMAALEQAPVYYAAMLLVTLPPSPEREQILDMLEVLERRLAALQQRPAGTLFSALSQDELCALYYAIQGYLALDAPGCNQEALGGVVKRMKPYVFQLQSGS